VITLRAAGRDDLPLLAGLEHFCQPYPWGPRRLAEELDHPDAIVVCAWDDARLMGFLVLRLVAGELWIFNIGTHPRHRREGIGDLLMARATSTAAAMGVPLWLEVREGNTSAVRLYQKHGMKVVGRRPRYYAPLPNTTEREAALQMTTATPAS
jgi:ribosomal-protein-alanine N-acetyltransferase